MLILLPSGIAAAKATRPLIIQPALSRSKKNRHGHAKYSLKRQTKLRRNLAQSAA
jgi:hypothetical protein